MSKEILFKDAVSRLSRIAGQREICISEGEARLRSWGIDDEKMITDVIKNLTDNGFINHQRYARAFVNDKFKYNGWGRIKITVQLRFKKIEDNIISEAIADLDEDEYREKVRKIAFSFLKSAKAKNRYELKSKLVRHISSKGFESDYAFSAFSEYFNSEK